MRGLFEIQTRRLRLRHKAPAGGPIFAGEKLLLEAAH
jgi:hypothetical protein